MVEYYVYNGLSQLVGYNTATSNLTRFYDSLGLLRQEFQAAGDFDEARTARRTTSSFQYDKSGARLSTESQSYLLDRTLPGEVIPAYEGEPTRQLRYKYNRAGQLWKIFDEQDPEKWNPVATYTYWGPGRVKNVTFKNGARSEFGYDGLSATQDQPNVPGDFGIGRVASVNHYAAGAANPFDERTMKWDRSGNKTERVVKMNGLASGSPLANRTFTYEYDSVNRLVQSTVSPVALGIAVGFSPSRHPACAKTTKMNWQTYNL